MKNAYEYLVKDDLKSAAAEFAVDADFDMRAKWGLFLVGLLQGKVERYPTYLELRNFLEIDIQFLIDNYKGDYVQRVVDCADFFFEVNPESYKFIGRVFAANGFEHEALHFLERGKSGFYRDPELHFILAGLHSVGGRPDAARQALDTCLQILPGYYPAVMAKV